MDYTSAGAAYITKPMPELGRLKAAAERVTIAAIGVDAFLDRFHGARPETSGGVTPIAESYRNDLDSLFGAIERMEVAVASLASIG